MLTKGYTTVTDLVKHVLMSYVPRIMFGTTILIINFSALQRVQGIPNLKLI
jgi:hypothetical protein